MIVAEITQPRIETHFFVIVTVGYDVALHNIYSPHLDYNL